MAPRRQWKRKENVCVKHCDKKDTSPNPSAPLIQCGQDVLDIIVSFLNNLDAPFCARVCSQWFHLFKLRFAPTDRDLFYGTVRTLQFRCRSIQTREQYLYIKQFQRMKCCESMYSCTARFGNVQDVRDLLQACNKKHSKRIIEGIVSHMLLTSRVPTTSKLSFLTDLWASCNNQQRRGFAQHFASAAYSNKLQVFEWLLAHDLAPSKYQANKDVDILVATGVRGFTFLNWIHDLSARFNAAENTPFAWLKWMFGLIIPCTGVQHKNATERWADFYKIQRARVRKNVPYFDKKVRIWFEEHPV